MDYETYLSATPGTVDIFFPTDFDMLQRAVNAMLPEQQPGDPGAAPSRAAQLWQPRQFFSKYGEVAATRTMSGAQCDVIDSERTRFAAHVATVLMYTAVTVLTIIACCGLYPGYNPLLEDYTNTRLLTT